MSAYRPIRQTEAWCSVQNSELTIGERYGQIYLLTSPHTNSIGCYQLVAKIAAVEAGLSTEEFENVLARLEAKHVAYFRSGYILVRTWFRHSTWESTFVGNVRKRAIAELSRLPATLLPLWLESSVEAGVPQDVVDGLITKPLESPSEGACKGLPHKNKNKDKNQNKDGTDTKRDGTDSSTAPSTIAPDEHAGQGSGSGVALLDIAEPHRPALEALRDSHGLATEQIQAIGFELSQRLEDAKLGRGKPIARVPLWLESLAAAARDGRPVLDRGADLSRRIADEAKRRTEALRESERRLAQDAAAASRRSQIADVLQAADPDDLAAIAELAAIKSARPSMPAVMRNVAREAVLSRQLPGALPGVAVAAAVEEWLSRLEQEA